MKWDKIHKLATDRKLQKKHIAEAMETHPNRVSDWQKDKWEPSLRQAFQLARLFKVPLDFLADDEMAELPPPPVSEAEAELLRIARRLGVEKAINRLILQDEPVNRPPKGQSYAEIRAANEEMARNLKKG